MSKLTFSEKARDDLLQIQQYISRDKPEAALEFVVKLEEQCAFIARHPESGTKCDDLFAGLRVFAFRSYAICFRQLSGRVRIERVLPPGLDVSRQTFG